MNRPIKASWALRGTLSLVFVFGLFAAGGAEPRSERSPSKPSDEKETVLITYHVISGKEYQLQALLAKAWDVYRKERLVLAEPHVVVRDKDAAGKSRFMEIFSWVSHDSPDHAPPSIKKLWDQMQECCEKRGGKPGIDGGEVVLVVPASS
jgi:hypothetical protein